MESDPDAQTLQQAVRLHQAGRLAEAEALYRQVLARRPDHAETLVYLGVLAGQVNRHAEGVALLNRALALNPSDTETRFNLGMMYAAMGRPAEAVAELRRVVAADPGFFEAHVFLGNALRSIKDLASAVAAYRGALALRPNDGAVHFALGDTLRDAGEVEQAIVHLRRAVEIDPRRFEAHNNLGNLLQGQGDLAAAVACFQAALRIAPDNPEALNNLGNALRAQGRLGDAREALARALALRPESPQIHANLATAAWDEGNLEEAIAGYEQALARLPAYPQAWNNLGIVLRESGRFDDATAAHRRAIAYDANDADAHYALAWSLLLRGDFEAGLREYEWRLARRGAARNLPGPRWGGEDLQGKTILLHAEQGFGDTIQFARYVGLVKGQGARVVLECQPELVTLLAGPAGADEVVARGQPLPKYDVHCPLMSLPFVLGTRLDSIPARVPYLSADPLRTAEWAEKLKGGNGLKVGVAWAGRPTYSNDRNRSMRVAELAPIARVEGVALHSLQAGAAASGAAEINAVDHSTELTDFAETAALVANLDLVVCVDTAVAHLAGAMGKPVWVMLPFVPDWRWMLDRVDSPWYPTARLFRQTRRGDWADVVRRVAEAIKAEM